MADKLLEQGRSPSPREAVNSILRRHPVASPEAAATILAVNNVAVKWVTFERMVGVRGELVAEGKFQPMFSTLDNTVPEKKARDEITRKGRFSGIDAKTYGLASDEAGTTLDRYMREGTPDTDYPRRSRDDMPLDTPVERFVFDVRETLYSIQRQTGNNMRKIFNLGRTDIE